MLITRIHDRLLPIALAHQADTSTGHRLQTASVAYQRALDNLANQTDSSPDPSDLTQDFGSAGFSALVRHP